MKSLLKTTLLLALLSAGALPAQRRTTGTPAAPFTVVEASIADLRSALEQKRTTSREIVLQYLTRIAKYEDRINAIITVNPNALAIADSMDRERAAGRIRGPLHGIPVALKDNIHTTDMPTILASPSSTVDPYWVPADRAPAPVQTSASGLAMSARRRLARSSARPMRTCWLASSRRLAASADTGSSRSAPTRTHRVP